MEAVSSSKNKELLWNILFENNIFSGIPNNRLETVKSIFEKNILRYVNENENIVDTNKKILSSVSKEINGFKETLLRGSNVKDDFKNEKVLVFDRNLQERKEYMDKTLNPDKPKAIDFSDKTDEPLDNNEMNNILERMQKERNIEMKTEEVEENKISENNLIVTNDIMVGDNKNDVAPKSKITSIEELLSENKLEVDVNNASPVRFQEENVKLNRPPLLNKEKYKRSASKVNVSDFNDLINEEYSRESRMNYNNKIDILLTKVSSLENKLESIIEKLDKQ
tara:strand:- start:3272 stop:4111 length:840 start_codon:yes stop_codon:yes gene_type:complete